jgi:hypothetical protein
MSEESKIFNKGVYARKKGLSISSNPYDQNNLIDVYKYNKWNAGWCDQDMIYRSEHCPKCKGELDIDDNFKQCHVCEKLWPINYNL